VIFLGDSITVGVGGTGNRGYADLLLENDSEDWPEFDGVDLESLFPGIDRVVDVSEGGALTTNVLYSQLPALEDEFTFPLEGETIVVMTAGGNDAQLALVLPEQVDEILDSIEQNIRDIVTWFQDPARFAGPVYFYASNVYEPSDGVGSSSCFGGFDYSEMIDDLDGGNARFRAAAEELGASMVDMRGHFLGHGMYNEDEQNPHYEADDPTRWFSSDCIHPNNRGHHEVRRLFYYAIDGRPLPAPGQQEP